MRLSSIPRVTGNHRKRWLVANGSRMETGVERKWRLVRGRVVFARQGRKSRRENEDEGLISLLSGKGRGRRIGFAAFKEPRTLRYIPSRRADVRTLAASPRLFRLEIGQSR